MFFYLWFFKDVSPKRWWAINAKKSGVRPPIYLGKPSLAEVFFGNGRERKEIHARQTS